MPRPLTAITKCDGRQLSNLTRAFTGRNLSSTPASSHKPSAPTTSRYTALSDAHYVSSAVKVLLARSATMLERRGSRDSDSAQPSGSSEEPTATSTSSRTSSVARENVHLGGGGRVTSGGGGGGGDGGGIPPSVMHAVTGVADVQDLKAELSVGDWRHRFGSTQRLAIYRYLPHDQLIDIPGV